MGGCKMTRHRFHIECPKIRRIWRQPTFKMWFPMVFWGLEKSNWWTWDFCWSSMELYRKKQKCISIVNSFNWNDKISISCFCEILIPYSRCSRIYKTDLQDLSARVFFKTLDLRDLRTSTNDICRKRIGIAPELFRVIMQIQVSK